MDLSGLLRQTLPSGIDLADHNRTTSLYSADYTYSYDKYSCIRGFYFAHIVFNYLIFFTGIACFITRALPPRFKAAHSWLGRTYILCMLWSTATSLLIHNTGLPLATLVAFAAVLIGLSIGWCAIVIHRVGITREAVALVETRIAKMGPPTDISLYEAISAARGDVVNAKTFRERFISLKALHGTLFFVSWFNIAGRIFASNQSGDFTCHTYPVYKPIDTKEFAGLGKPLTLVPARDPDYARLPWAIGQAQWGLITIGGSALAALIVGVIWSYIAGRKARRAALERDTNVDANELEQPPIDAIAKDSTDTLNS